MVKKIAAGIAVLMLVSLLAVGLILDGNASVRSNLARTIEHDTPEVEASYEIEINILEVSVGVLRYVDTGSASFRLTAVDDLADIQRYLTQYEATGPGGLSEDLRSDVARFTRTSQEILSTSDLMRGSYRGVLDGAEELSELLDAADRGASPEASILAFELQNAIGHLERGVAESVSGRNVHSLSYLDSRAGRIERLGERTAPLLPPAIAGELRSGTEVLTSETADFIDAKGALERSLDRFQAQRRELDGILDEQVQAVAVERSAATQLSARRSADRVLLVLMVLGPVFMILSVAAGIAMTRAVKVPVRRLVQATKAVGSGDLGHRVPQTKDELGELAAQFNSMVERLETSEQEIHAKQLELAEANERLSEGLQRLEVHSEQSVVINEMGDLIQACNEESEAYGVIGAALRKLLPGVEPTLFVLEPSGTSLEPVGDWGADDAKRFLPKDCWGLRTGRAHIKDLSTTSVACLHEVGHETYACIPLVAQGETLGSLVLARPGEGCITQECDNTLLRSVGEHIALALVNFRLREKLRHQSIRDPLTGLFNRRYLEETLERELHRAEREQKPLSVVVLDVDHFKSYNDTYGHIAGDEVLRRLGGFLQSSLRAEDICCRYGGEEFVLVMPSATSVDAFQRVDEMRERFKAETIGLGGIELAGLTFSAGVTSVPQGGTARGEELIVKADEALYEAKNSGRDRVVLYTDKLAHSPSAHG